MDPRSRIRCPACRAIVSVTVLWATADVCPQCSQPLPAVAGRRRFEPGSSERAGDGPPAPDRRSGPRVPERAS